MYPQILKSADFDNQEDDTQVVRIGSHYAEYGMIETTAFLRGIGSITLARVNMHSGGGEIEQFTLSTQEMDALLKAWVSYKAEYDTCH